MVILSTINPNDKIGLSQSGLFFEKEFLVKFTWEGNRI